MKVAILFLPLALILAGCDELTALFSPRFSFTSSMEFSLYPCEQSVDRCAKLTTLVFPLRLLCSKLCPPRFCCLPNPRSRSRRHVTFLLANPFTAAGYSTG